VESQKRTNLTKKHKKILIPRFVSGMGRGVEPRKHSSDYK